MQTRGKKTYFQFPECSFSYAKICSFPSQRYGFSLTRHRFFPIICNFAATYQHCLAMKYISSTFKLQCDEALKDTVADVLASLMGDAGFESFERTADGDLVGYAQAGAFDKRSIDTIVMTFPIENVGITYDTALLPDTDWNAIWEEQGFEPIVIERRLVVYDARKGVPENTDDSVKLLGIATEMAFGTGTHETTRMILAALSTMQLHGCRVLDCGCGTGILGIAASLFGASDVCAYDIDEWSVRNTLKNAAANNVVGMTVRHGDASILNQINGTFDVVLANINRNILLSDIPIFAGKCSRRAQMLLSGFYKSDIPMLEEKANEQGLLKLRETTDGDWAMLWLEKAD